MRPRSVRRRGPWMNPIVTAVVFVATYLMFAGPWGCATEPARQAEEDAGSDLRDLLQLMTGPESLAVTTDSTSTAAAPRVPAAVEGPPAPPAIAPAPAGEDPPSPPSLSQEEWEQRVLAAPQDVAAWLALSAAHRRAGDPALALRAARRVVALAPGDPRGDLALAFSLLALRRTDEALDAFERVCERDAENAAAWNAAGYIWLVREDLERACRAFERAVALPDCPAHTHNNLGIVYERLGRPEWADREYRRCLELDPGHPTAAGSRARVAAFLAVRPVVGQSQSR